MWEDVAIDSNDSHRRALIPRMKKCMTWECEVSVDRVSSDCIGYRDKNGTALVRQADNVLYATGLRERNELAESLKDCCSRFVAVGDCVSPRQVKQVVYEGFCAAMDIL